VAGLHGRGVDGLLCPRGHPCPPYIGGRTRSVGRSPRRVQQGNLSLVNYNMEDLSSRLNPSELPCLARQAVFSSGQGRLGNLLEGLQEVVWATN
jgi:hypothetical protein